jgi:hypothetical protein
MEPQTEMIEAVKDSSSMSRFTDRSRYTVKTAFPHLQTTTERELIAAFDEGGVAGQILKSLGITAAGLKGDVITIERQDFVLQATEISKQCGVNYVGTEHLLLAIVGMSNSALAKAGATVQRIEEMLVDYGIKAPDLKPVIVERKG